MELELGRTGELLAPERIVGERSEPQRSVGASNSADGPVGVPEMALADPEVPERPVRRRYSAEYKRRILREADACERGELGALLRREGLYTSHLAQWRGQRSHAEIQALSGKKRGPKAKPTGPLIREIEKLRRENQRLQKRLQQAEALLEIQKKLSEILGVPLNPPPSDETE